MITKIKKMLNRCECEKCFKKVYSEMKVKGTNKNGEEKVVLVGLCEEHTIQLLAELGTE